MNVYARLWFRKNDKNYIGTGRAELLSRVAQTGSIAKAAREMRMSYKAAWDSMDIMNKLSSSPLVQSSNGGKGGGGTKLTASGFKLLEAFNETERVKDIFFNYLDNVEDFDELLERLSHLESALKGFKKA